MLTTARARRAWLARGALFVASACSPSTGPLRDAGQPEAAPAPPPDGGHRDARVPPDATGHGEASSDSGHVTRDGGKDGAPGADGAVDASSPPLACSAGTIITVDDFGASGASYGTPFFLTLAGAGGALAFAQLSSDTSGLREYRFASADAGASQEDIAAPEAPFVLRDVQASNAGTSSETVQALGTWRTSGTDAGTTGLEILSFGPTGASTGSHAVTETGVGAAPFPAALDGRLALMPTGDAGEPLFDGGLLTAAFALGTNAQAIENLTVFAADVGRDASALLAADLGTSAAFGPGDVFFGTPQVVGAIVGPPLVDAGFLAVQTSPRIVQDASTAVTLGAGPNPPNAGSLLAGHASVTTPGKVFLLAGARVEGGALVQLSVFKTSPFDLAGLPVGQAPPFEPGGVLPSDSLLFEAPAAADAHRGGAAWSGDDFIAVLPTTGGDGLELTWISSQGKVIVHGTPVAGRMNVGATAIAIVALSEALGGSVDVVWTEHAHGQDGAMFDRMYFTQIVCSGGDGG